MNEPENKVGSLADKIRMDAQTTTPKQPPHVVIVARAGTGKTTTLIEGARLMDGLPVYIDPSPQQRAIWDQMLLSRGARTKAMIAFNKSIATTLEERVPPGWKAMTLHSMGYKVIRRVFGNVDVSDRRVDNIIHELLGTTVRTIYNDDPILLQATKTLVALVKQNLVPLDVDDDSDQDVVDGLLQDLVDHYDIPLDPDEDRYRRGWRRGKGERKPDSYRRQVFDLVPKVIERCRDVAKDGTVDFNDMVWIPVALGLDLFQYDILVCDECQDLCRCQQALTRRAGRRLIYCGDDRQAIYGFAGADCDSIPRIYEQLKHTPQGCVRLPLTVTRRCGHAIVEQAQQIVPDFEAHPSNPQGIVSRAHYPSAVVMAEGSDPDPTTHFEPDYTYMERVRSGDLVLCRVNAPLISHCFRFIRQGRRANIIGRDIGTGIISTINKTKAADVPSLVQAVQNWAHEQSHKEHAKKNPSETRLIAIQDKAQCILVFTEGARSVEEVRQRVARVFSDTSDGEGIRLSSVHRAKGLEAKRVFILVPKGAEMPHPMASSPWQIEQEWNIKYVAITRAIEELIWVS